MVKTLVKTNHRPLSFQDGKLLLGNSVSAEASVADFGVGASHNQYTSGDSDELHYHCPSNNVFEDAQQIIECPRCEHDYNVLYNKLGVSLKDPTSISVGVSGHFILGGHASAKFSPLKALMLFVEDWRK